MSTDWIDFKELRASLDFGAVLAHYGVQLRNQGQQQVGACPLPQHPADKRHKQTFSANLEKRLFQCFGCKGKGNALDFVVYMEHGVPSRGNDVRKAAEKLQGIFPDLASLSHQRTARPKPDANKDQPAAVEEKRTEQALYNVPLDFRLRDLDPKHPYLVSRGFNQETIRRFDLGYCSKGYFKDRVVIPLHNPEGKLVGYAGRLTDDSKAGSAMPKYLFPGDRKHNGVTHGFRKSELLYNVHQLTPRAEHIIVVEGFASVWWLYQLGITDVVAAMGSSVSDAQVHIIRQALGSKGIVSILFDGDDAGRKGASAAAVEIASHAPVRICPMGNGLQPTDLRPEDLDEVLGW